jgi:hypothetical protein
MTARFSAKPTFTIAEASADEHTVSTVCTVSNGPTRIVRWLEVIFGKPCRFSPHRRFVALVYLVTFREPHHPEIRVDRG